MLATDPRFPMYVALQRLLCATLNATVHWDTAHAPIDRVAWEAYQRDEAADAIGRQNEAAKAAHPGDD